MSETCDVSLADIPDAAFVSKKCFMADRGFGGTVFSTGNAVIVQINGMSMLLRFIISCL